MKTLVKRNFFNGLAAVVLVLAGVVFATGGINDAHYRLHVDPGNTLDLKSRDPTPKEVGEAIIASDGWRD